MHVRIGMLAFILNLSYMVYHHCGAAVDLGKAGDFSSRERGSSVCLRLGSTTPASRQQRPGNMLACMHDDRVFSRVRARWPHFPFPVSQSVSHSGDDLETPHSLHARFYSIWRGEMTVSPKLQELARPCATEGAGGQTRAASSHAQTRDRHDRPSSSDEMQIKTCKCARVGALKAGI
jgi:hypothetical protein